MFRIIHISDLHLHADLFVPRVIDALCEDIRAASSERPINAIAFTGDAAAKGRTGREEIESILAKFVSLVREAAGGSVPFLICPGNHDIDLNRREQMFTPIFANVTSPDKANELVQAASTEPAKAIWGHVEGFRSLARAIDTEAFEAHPLYYTKTIATNGLTVGFACVNSAWMTSGGGAGDYGKLYIGEYLLDQALKELKAADVRILLLHHPLDWLAPEEKSRILRFLNLNFHGVLCGHKHDNNADTLNSNIGSLFTSNTGCVYQSNDYFNGYSIVDLDPEGKKWILNAREYYFQREVFDKSIRFASDGKWITPFSTAIYSTQVAIPGEVIRAMHDRANSLLLSYSSSEVAPKSIGALFVEPPLSRMSEKELITKTKGEALPAGAFETLTSLGLQAEAIFFIGKREAGKSLLLHQIAINHFSSFRSNARLGVVIDLNAAKKLTEAGLLEQAVEFCGGEIPRRDLVRLFESGDIVACVDNVRIHDQKAIDLVRAFVKRFPKVRYVFATSEELLDSLAGYQIPEIGIPVTKIFVHSFRSRHTKELIKRWFGEGDLELSKRVQSINLLLDRLRVPRTPFIVSVLSWVLEQQPNAAIVNRAAAIEVLIEGLLEKFKEAKVRKGIDSTIQQHFLSEFALYLDGQDRDWIGGLDFDKFVIGYFESRGLAVSTEGFAIELVSRGILFSSGDRVGFKFDCFRAYFLARKYAENQDLWQEALRADRVTRYVTELDLFTGLHRDRGDVLKAASELCRQTYDALDINFRLEEIDKVGDVNLLVTSNFITRVEERIAEARQQPNSVAHERPDLISADHEESRKRIRLPDMGAIGRFVESLRAFSMILRNSELVDDVDLKRESFALAIEHWACTTIAVILEVVEGTKSFAETAEAESKEEALATAALFKAISTQMIVSVMSDSLATPKLERFVREKTNDPRTLVRTLAVVLSFDAEDDQAVEYGRSLLRDFKGSGFVAEILFLRLLNSYLQQGADALHPKLRDFLGDIVVQLRGGGAREAATIKANFLNRLDKSLLVKEIVNKPGVLPGQTES